MDCARCVSLAGRIRSNPSSFVIEGRRRTLILAFNSSYGGHMPGQLAVHELELIYDDLARAIDSVEPDKRSIFLVKLALMNADEIGSADIVRSHIQASIKDL
jgi:hypothetical protein